MSIYVASTELPPSNSTSPAFANALNYTGKCHRSAPLHHEAAANTPISCNKPRSNRKHKNEQLQFANSDPSKDPDALVVLVESGTKPSISRYRFNYYVNNLSSSTSSPPPSFEAEARVNGELRNALLEQVDKELGKGGDRAALSLVKVLQSEPSLRCFGAAQQVAEKLYSLTELKLNGIETSSLLLPKDNTLGTIERNLHIAALMGFISAWIVFGLGPEDL